MTRSLAIPLLLFAAAARADSPAGRIDPYLTDDAVAVARVDVAGLDVDAAYRNLRPVLAAFAPANDAPPAEVPASVRQSVETARKLGVREAYFVLATAGLPNEPGYVVVPVPEGADARAILDFMAFVPLPSKAIVNGAAIAGPEATIERLRAKAKPAARPQLAEAFAAHEGATVQAVLVPSADQRRVLRETLPDLPEQYGGATGERLAGGLKWASLGVGLGPKLSVALAVQADDEASAAALRDAIAAGLRRLSTEPAVLGRFPAFPLFVGSLIPKQEGAGLTLRPDAAIDTATKMLAAVADAAAAESRRASAMNNLKQLGLAFHNFHDAHGSLPPNAGHGPDGKPLLSWRVYLLPWLEQGPLFQQFRLDEPWDGAHNKTLIEKMPDVFRSPTVRTKPGETVYLVPTGEGLIFDGPTGTTFREINDGLSNTILAVEATAAEAVPWTKPDDLAVDPKNPLAGLTDGRESFPALIGDGSVRTFPTTFDAEAFRRFLTPAGGEPIEQQP